MSNVMNTGEAAALVAAVLRGHVRALADEYAAFLHGPGSAVGASGSDEVAGAGEDAAARGRNDAAGTPKAFQARHAAGRAALAHLALLLKLAGEGGGGELPAEESEEELLAEARRNLERPA